MNEHIAKFAQVVADQHDRHDRFFLACRLAEVLEGMYPDFDREAFMDGGRVESIYADGRR